MTTKDHANLLSIFFWIYSGLQSIIVLLMMAYAGFMGYAVFAIETNNSQSDADGQMVIGIIFLVFLIIALFGFTSMVINIAAGYGLRKERNWTRRLGIIASILSIASFLCGGIFLLPFGTALGIYGLWFFYGDQGKYFPQNGTVASYNPPMPPNNWQ